MGIPGTVASAVTILWLLFIGWKIHRTIQENGSWYNHLQLDPESPDNTYANRARITFTERLDMTRTIGGIALLTAVIYGFTYVFTAGLLVTF